MRPLFWRRPGGLGHFWFFTECFLAVVCVVLDCLYLGNRLFDFRGYIGNAMIGFKQAGGNQLAAPDLE